MANSSKFQSSFSQWCQCAHEHLKAVAVGLLLGIALINLMGCGGHAESPLDDVEGFAGTVPQVVEVAKQPGYTAMPTPHQPTEGVPTLPLLPAPVTASELKIDLPAEPAPVSAAAPASPVKEVASSELMSFSITGIGEYSNEKRALKKPDETLSAALLEALERWSAATCVSFEIRAKGGQHRVQFATPEELPGTRVGQVTGQWSAALVQVSTFVPYAAKRRIMVHEIGHLLSQNNGHSADGILSEYIFEDGADVVSESALSQVCATLDCKCFNPEPLHALATATAE